MVSASDRAPLPSLRMAVLSAAALSLAPMDNSAELGLVDC